jgi:hypothetical protein
MSSLAPDHFGKALLDDANKFIANLIKNKTDWEPGQEQWIQTLSDTDKKEIKGLPSDKIKMINFLWTRDAAASGAAAAAPKSILPPQITGKKEVGQELSVTYGTWSNLDPIDMANTTYQWKRDGHDIKGGNKTKYTIANEDLGKQITCDVTVKSNSNHTNTATSNSINVPDASASPPPAPPAPSAAKAIADGNDYIQKLLGDPHIVIHLKPEEKTWLNSLSNEDKQKIGKIPNDKDRDKQIESMYDEHKMKKTDLNTKMSEIVTSLLPIIYLVKKEYTNVIDAFKNANTASPADWNALKTALADGNQALEKAKEKYNEYLETKKNFDLISAGDAASGASTGIGKSGGSNLYSKKNRKSHTASRPHSRRRRTRKHSSASSSHHKKMKFVHHS